MKKAGDQKLARRKPRQERAQHKIELILEAATRLLGKGGLAALTTNAVAETAGVSIGTLYQYFANKDAILDALADREMAELGRRILTALDEPILMTPADRVARVIRAVTASFGGRRQVHRLVMEHSLSHGGRRLAPLIAQLEKLLADSERLAGSGAPRTTSRAEAFVLTSAFAGVMRAMIMTQDPDTPPQDEIEEALVRLVVGFTHRPAAEA